MNKSIRTLNLDEVTVMLKGDEFIVVDPIASESFIYDIDIDGYFEKEFVFLAEDVIPTLERWSESKIIVNRTFSDKPCGYSYCGWGDLDGDTGKEPEITRKQAIALGLR